jgi:hypothetical protein
VAACERGQPSLAWYTTLLNHALHPTRPKQCCVLWGAPGVGKTLAVERLGEMLRRQRARRGAAASFLNADRRAGVAELGYFSCAAIEDSADVAPFLLSVKAFLTTAAPDSLLVVDDVDALQDDRASLARLFALLAPASRARKRPADEEKDEEKEEGEEEKEEEGEEEEKKKEPAKKETAGAVLCRRVIIVNDYYERAYFTLRQPPLKQHFYELHVERAHVGALAAYLQRKIATLAREPEAARAIAERSGGDVRAALIAATLDCAVLRGSRAALCTSVGVALDTQSRDEPLTQTLVRCARTRLLDEVYGADRESAAECLFVNHPRYLTARPAANRLDAALEIADALSVGDLYESAMQRGYEGASADELDKRLAFELALAAPLTLLGNALAGTQAKYDVWPRLEFPHRKMLQAQRARADSLHRGGADELAPRAATDAYDLVPLLLGETRRARLHAALCAAQRERRLKKGEKLTPPELAARNELCAVAARFVQHGMSAAEFGRTCTLHLTLTDTPHTFTDAAIAALFSLGPEKPVLVSAPVAKKPRHQTTITAMLGRLKK